MYSEATAIEVSLNQYSDYEVGDYFHLHQTVSVFPENALDQRVHYSSSKPLVGNVNANGRVHINSIASGFTIHISLGEIRVSVQFIIPDELEHTEYYLQLANSRSPGEITGLYLTNEESGIKASELFSYEKQCFTISRQDDGSYLIECDGGFLSENSDGVVELTGNASNGCFWLCQRFPGHPSKVLFYRQHNTQIKWCLTYLDDTVILTPNIYFNEEDLCINLTPGTQEGADIVIMSVPLDDETVDPLLRSYGNISINSALQEIAEGMSLDVRLEELSDELVIDTLTSAKYVIIRGHGAPGRFFYDEEQTQQCYSVDFFEMERFDNIELLIFCGCECGLPHNGFRNNLVDSAYEHGAKCVIGFENKVDRTMMDEWLSLFFLRYKQYKLGSQVYSTVADICQSVSDQLNEDGVIITLNGQPSVYHLQTENLFCPYVRES